MAMKCPVKIQKDLKGKFQKMQTAKTKPVKMPGGCCAKDTCGPRGQTCSKREGSGLHPYRTGRSHGAEDKNVQNREVLYQNDRMKMIFHGPLIPHGSKKLKRRKGVWQAVRDDSKDSDEGDSRRPVRAKEED